METDPEGSGNVDSIHYDSFTHDYYPLALPLMVDEEMRAYMKDALSKDANGNAVIYGFFDFYLTRMEGGGEIGRSMRAQLEKAVREAGVNLITLTLGNASKPLDDYDSILKSVEWWERLQRAFPLMEKCTEAAEIDGAFRRGKIGLVYALQDMGCIGEDLERLPRLFDAGVRLGQLTYNRTNAIGSGCAEDPGKGLSPFGKEAVKRMNRLGMVVDLSHCNYRTTLDGIGSSDLPVAVSHSSCKAVHDHARAKSDDELKALSENRGYFGLYTVPFFLCDDPQPDFSIFLRHLEHVIGILGIDNVGIGSDWGLWSPDVPGELTEAAKQAAYKMGFKKDMKLSVGTSLKGMGDYREWIRITESLVLAGYGKKEIAGILGGNFLSFLRRAGFGCAGARKTEGAR
jgi:membrane dipeptidase